MDRSEWRERWVAFREWFSGRVRWQRITMLAVAVYVVFIAMSWVAVGIGNLTGGNESASPVTTNPPVTTAATSPAPTSPAPTTAKSSSSVEDSIEYKMAVVDAGGYVDPNDSIIGVYRSALSRAESNCPNSKQQLADMAVRATQILADNGIRATALEMVQAVNGSVAGLDAGDCTDVYAALITLMING